MNPLKKKKIAPKPQNLAPFELLQSVALGGATVDGAQLQTGDEILVKIGEKVDGIERRAFFSRPNRPFGGS